MKELIFFISFIAMFILIPTSFSSEQSMTIHEYLELARKNDVEIKNILNDRVQTTFLKSLSLPSSAVVFTVQNQYGFAIGDGERTTFLAAGAKKTFNNTGTTVSAGYGLNKQEDREEEETYIEAGQSLFKNALGKQTRKQARKLDLENEVIVLRTVEAYEDYVASIILNYLDWQLTHLNRHVSNSLLGQSQTLQKYIEQRKKRNIADSVDVGKIELETMGYKEAILELDVSMTNQLSAISATTGKSIKELKPEDNIKWIEFKMDMQNEKEAALENSRMLKAYTLTQKAGNMEISLRKEDLHPDLNLIFGFSYDNSTRFNVSTNRKEIYVGFNLSLPIFETQGNAQVKKAKYEKMTASLARQLYYKNLTTSLEAQISRIEKQRQRVELSEKKWKLSEDVAKKERVRYQNGKIELETLIIARQAVASNHFNYLSNQIQLNKDLIEWLRLTDRLVVKDKIKLK